MQDANATASEAMVLAASRVAEVVGGEPPPPQPATRRPTAAVVRTKVGMSGRRRRMFGSFRSSHVESEWGQPGACAAPGHRPVTVLHPCYPRGAIVTPVKIDRRPGQPSLRLARPQTTVRWRLTLLYSVLFLICGAALLALSYWLFTKYAYGYYPPNPNLPLYGNPPNPVIVAFAKRLARQRSADLHNLRVAYAIALAVMAVVSGVLGWVVAGRALAPLRTIIATAEQISGANLHERLAMRGPRDELRLLADTIDGLLERLEAAFNAQRRFVANASHDLRKNGLLDEHDEVALEPIITTAL